MSVGQNLILPFIFFYPWLSAFPLFGSSCPPAQGLPKSRLPAQAVAEGPEHQGEQADRGDVGRGLGDGGGGVDAVADLLEAEEAAGGQRVGKLLHGSGLVGNICHHTRSVVSSPQMSATEVMNLAKQLPEMEVLDLARMLEAWTAAMVDQKFEAVVKSGAFDQMAADALHELEAGKTIPLDEVLHDPRLS